MKTIQFSVLFEIVALQEFMYLFLSISMFPPCLLMGEATSCSSTKACYLIKLGGNRQKKRQGGPEKEAKRTRCENIQCQWFYSFVLIEVILKRIPYSWRAERDRRELRAKKQGCTAVKLAALNFYSVDL